MINHTASVVSWIIFSLPGVVLAIGYILYWIKDVISILVIAILTNLFVGFNNTYFIYKTFLFYMPQKFDLTLLNFLKNQNWLLIVINILPLILAILSIRYLISQPMLIHRFRIGKLKKSGTFGTAKLMDLHMLQKLNHPDGIPVGAMPQIKYLNDVKEVIHSIQNKKGGEIIRIKTHHTTVIAPSGTGKGIGVVIPTLLEYKGSVFVTDIKGENYSITHKHRESMGKKVVAFDPFKITVAPPTSINPLDFLKPENKSIVDDAAVLAQLICQTKAHEGSTADYFQSQAGAVVQCLLLYVVCSDEFSPSEKNLTKVYDLLCLPVSDLIEMFKHIGENETLGFGAPSRLANRLVSTEPRELSGILNSAFVEMRFVDTPFVRESISYSSINISEITQGDLDLFICIPPEKLDSQSRLLRLFTGIVFLEMQNAKGKIGKHDLLMLIDEMPALEHIKQIEQILKYGRGYGVSLMAIAQTIESIQAVYPKSWRTFLTNQLILFFGCTDEQTCELVSKMTGDTTVQVTSSNSGSGKQSRTMELLGNASTQEGTTVSETGRRLLKFEDVRTLGDKVMLAFVRGQDLIMCQRIDYRERPEWRGMWGENPLHKRQ